jgi:hemolysin activation/secretion protein
MKGRSAFRGFGTYTCVGAICAFVPLTAALAQDSQAAQPQIVAPPPTFLIAAIDVTGVTKLTAAEIENIVYPFMGPGKTPADVESARKAVQDAYAKKGFETAIVEVPPQPAENFARGLVQVKVSEAPVGQVTVVGLRYHSAERVLQQLPSIKQGQPLNFKDLQAELSVANRFPDREIRPSFDPGQTTGSIDVELKVKDELPLHSTLTLNNDHSANTTSLRLSGSVRYTNILGVGHTISAGFAIAPEKRTESAAVFGSYSAPLMGTPWTLVLSGYKSNSDIATLGGTNVLGNGYQAGLQAIYRLPIDKAYHAFRAGLDYKDFKQDIGLRGLTVNSSPIRYIPLTLGYTYAASGETTALDLDVSSTLGLRVIKSVRCFDPTATVCRPEDQFTNKDVDSTENFAHINLDATYSARFKGDWVTEVKFSGQYADSHLVANEQYAIGGLSNVRGYFQSEIVGDRGFAGSVEFRAPSFATYIGTFVDDFRFFSFMEGGVVSVIDPLPDQKAVFRIGSFGGGARIKLLRRFTGEILVGVPVNDGPDSKRGDPRVAFSVKGEF